MAEAKRLQLVPPAPLQKEKKSKECAPTYRFDIELPKDPTDTQCFEISYKELVRNRENADKSKAAADDPYGEDDDNLKELARKLEEKYNPKLKKKRKKVGFCEDFVDRGMGYDETDPFIDNEEAYDELVPSTITTEHGGFYINCGTLDFKNLSNETDNGIEAKLRRKRRKQKESVCFNKDLKRPHGDEFPKRRGRRPASESASALPKIKKKTQPTVADMLQQRKTQLQQHQQETLQQLQFTPIVVERSLETKVNVEVPQQPTVLVAAPPVSNCKISEAIESVVKGAIEEGASNGSAGPVLTGSSDGEESTPKLPINSIESSVPKLPENLPSDLDVVLEKLKQAAYNSEEGKCKFFSDDINRMLLSVELKSQELTSAQRSTIYSHLASHLPCTKETLQKRAKKLRLDQEDNKLRVPMQKLKDAIAVVMPDLVEKYTSSLQAPSVKEEVKVDVDAIPLTDEDFSEDEERKTNPVKKIFEWNDTIRMLLCDVVRIKLKCYEVSKTRIQSAEEYLKHFLETEVKNLWPPGWMRARTLFKESKGAHQSIINKQKKPLMLSKRTGSLPIGAKPISSIMNSVLFTQESNNMEPVAQFVDRCVPSSVALSHYIDSSKMSSPVSAAEEIRQAEFLKLFTYPINKNLKFGSPKKPTQVSSEMKLDLPVTTTKTVPSSSTKSVEAYLASSVLTSNKAPDLNPAAEGSLASDMLARIISASLADFPYAGSSNSENLHSKSQTIITSSTNFSLAKDNRVMNSKIPVDSFTSPKHHEDVKSISSDSRKPSQDSSLGLPVRSIQIDSLINAHHSAMSSDIAASSSLNKTKCSPMDAIKSPVNLKLKDVMVPQSRQFAEAFERSEASILTGKAGNKMQNYKTASSLLRSIPPTTASISSIRLQNAAELLNDISASASPRLILSPKASQRVPQDMATRFNASAIAQVPPLGPYKKREKYAPVTSKSDQWGFLDSGLGASLLEGMKGFPCPVSPLPDPPPAHRAVPPKPTVQHKGGGAYKMLPDNQNFSAPYNSNKVRVLKTVETPSHNQHGHVGLPAVDQSRRLSLIKLHRHTPGSVTQPSSTSGHYLAGSQSQISINTTSPSHSSSNAIKTMLHSHAHSPQSEVSYGLNQNQMSIRPCPSPVQSHTSRTSPSNVHVPHISQALFLSHPPSHSTPSHQAQALTHCSTPFVHTHPSTCTSMTGTFTFSQDQKTNPRSN